MTNWRKRKRFSAIQYRHQRARKAWESFTLWANGFARHFHRSHVEPAWRHPPARAVLLMRSACLGAKSWDMLRWEVWGQMSRPWQASLLWLDITNLVSLTSCDSVLSILVYSCLLCCSTLESSPGPRFSSIFLQTRFGGPPCLALHHLRQNPHMSKCTQILTLVTRVKIVPNPVQFLLCYPKPTKGLLPRRSWRKVSCARAGGSWRMIDLDRHHWHILTS